MGCTTRASVEPTAVVVCRQCCQAPQTSPILHLDRGASCRQHSGAGFCHSIHDNDACVHFGGCAAGPHWFGAQLKHADDLTARTTIIFDLSYFRGFEFTVGATMHAFDMLTSFDMIRSTGWLRQMHEGPWCVCPAHLTCRCGLHLQVTSLFKQMIIIGVVDGCASSAVSSLTSRLPAAPGQ